MQTYQQNIIEKLSKRYGKLDHKNYYGQEGQYHNNHVTVVYESNRLFRINLKFNACEVEILDPKEDANIDEEFFAKLEKIGSSLMSQSALSDFLVKHGSKIRSTSPLKFSLHTDDYIFSVADGHVTCSLLDAPKIKTIIFRAKKDTILNVEMVYDFFSEILKETV